MGSDADLSTEDLAGRGGAGHGDRAGTVGGGPEPEVGATAAAAMPETSRVPDAPTGPDVSDQGLGGAVLGETDTGTPGQPGVPTADPGAGTPGQAGVRTADPGAGTQGQAGVRTADPGAGGRGSGEAGDAMSGVALLAPADGDRFRQRWSDVQAHFVDDPQDAVRTADGLVAELMQSLARGFSEHKGRLEAQWQRGGNPDTEELRQALQMYRSFFNRLLST